MHYEGGRLLALKEEFEGMCPNSMVKIKDIKTGSKE
jgi:hypothetical protein